MNDQEKRKLAIDLEYIRARCEANAEVAREDPDRRRRTVSVQVRTAAQVGKPEPEQQAAFETAEIPWRYH